MDEGGGCGTQILICNNRALLILTLWVQSCQSSDFLKEAVFPNFLGCLLGLLYSRHWTVPAHSMGVGVGGVKADSVSGRELVEKVAPRQTGPR